MALEVRDVEFLSDQIAVYTADSSATAPSPVIGRVDLTTGERTEMPVDASLRNLAVTENGTWHLAGASWTDDNQIEILRPSGSADDMLARVDAAGDLTLFAVEIPAAL